jgi:hypothetical protein
MDDYELRASILTSRMADTLSALVVNLGPK